MNDFQKVLVVDSGERFGDDALSVELAELGFSSVTTSYEAADEVLGLIQTPSAIVLKMPRTSEGDEYARFIALAATLKGRVPTGNVPVIMWDRSFAAERGGLSGLLSSTFGPQALSEPDL